MYHNTLAVQTQLRIKSNQEVDHYRVNLYSNPLKVVPEPKGIADNLDELASDLGKVNFVDKNGVEQKIVEIKDDVDDDVIDDEDTMMAPNEADVERIKRMLRVGKK